MNFTLAALLCLASTACSRAPAAPAEELPPPTVAFAHWTGAQRLVAYRQFEKVWPLHEVKGGGTAFPLPQSAQASEPRAVAFVMAISDAVRTAAATQ